MSVAVSEDRRAPSLGGVPVAWDMLTKGLHVDGAMIQGIEGSDIATVRMGRRRVFLLTSPDYVDHVLHDAADKYHKSIEYELLRAVLGLNLFTDEGESWRRHRMMLNPVMAKRHVRSMVDLMIDPIDSFTADLDGARRSRRDRDVRARWSSSRWTSSAPRSSATSSATSRGR